MLSFIISFVLFTVYSVCVCALFINHILYMIEHKLNLFTPFSKTLAFGWYSQPLMLVICCMINMYAVVAYLIISIITFIALFPKLIDWLNQEVEEDAEQQEAIERCLDSLND